MYTIYLNRVTAIGRLGNLRRFSSSVRAFTLRDLSTIYFVFSCARVNRLVYSIGLVSLIIFVVAGVWVRLSASSFSRLLGGIDFI